jgi:hypothetical protein
MGVVLSLQGAEGSAGEGKTTEEGGHSLVSEAAARGNSTEAGTTAEAAVEIIKEVVGAGLDGKTMTSLLATAMRQSQSRLTGNYWKRLTTTAWRS